MQQAWPCTAFIFFGALAVEEELFFDPNFAPVFDEIIPPQDADVGTPITVDLGGIARDRVTVREFRDGLPVFDGANSSAEDTR